MELLLVISIIFVLMGMVVTLGPVIMDEVNNVNTQGKLKLVEQAVMRYLNQYDVCPPDSEVTAGKIKNDKLLKALKEFGITEDKLMDGWGGPLIYDRARNEKGELEINTGFPSDPRGKKILKPDKDEDIYQKFFIWSTGKDSKKEATGDDILLEH